MSVNRTELLDKISKVNTYINAVELLKCNNYSKEIHLLSIICCLIPTKKSLF